ncbi:NPCBM/NEW2 domain-containing protein [Planctomycetota bacterium]
MSNHELPENLAELMILALEGELEQEDFASLDRLLAKNPAARQYYFEFISTYVGLHKSEGNIGLSTIGEAPLGWDERVRKSEEQDESVRLLAERAYAKFKEEQRIQQEKLAHKAYLARRRRLIVGLTSMAALVIVFLWAWLAQTFLTPTSPEESPVVSPPPLVASILKSIDAHWEANDVSTAAGTRLAVSAPLHLKQGLMQLSFDQGAEVILQAPSHIRLDGTGRMMLYQGVLSTVVPESALGFAVETPAGLVTDYGTEFGVIARQDGDTETQVYLGKVKVEADPDMVSTHEPQFLTEGQANAVNRSGQIYPIDFQSQQIVREMPKKPGLGIPGKRLDLADMVGGGNGYGTGTLESGIDPATGLIANPLINEIRTGTMAYTRVPALPFVDGVFVPNGAMGPVRISGEDHVFDDCPPTSGRFYSEIAHGGRLLTFGTTEYRTLTLDGTVYGTQEHPAIVIHANAGITFDLEAIRTAHPGFEFTRFRSICGISQNVPNGVEANASIWVLVDGEERLQKIGVTPIQGAIPVDVQVDRLDRYLTLMVTDGDQIKEPSISNDYGLFAEPVLE